MFFLYEETFEIRRLFQLLLPVFVYVHKHKEEVQQLLGRKSFVGLARLEHVNGAPDSQAYTRT